MVPLPVACIGSRELAEPALAFCRAIGMWLASNGLGVRSGNALGADQAYAQGASEVAPSAVTLVLPWEGYESSAILRENRVMTPPYPAWAEEEAARLHGAWAFLKSGPRALHTRNIVILDGAAACIAWPNAKKSWGGGTGMGMRYASEKGIPLFNLAHPEVRDALADALGIGRAEMDGQMTLF